MQDVAVFDYFYLPERDTSYFDQGPECTKYFEETGGDDLWYKPPGLSTRSSTYKLRVARAKDVCGRCIVRDQCLADGLKMDAELGHRHGIWGGYTEDEREAIAQQTQGLAA